MYKSGVATQIYLFIIMLTSSIVFFEPSPYDLFMTIFLLLIFVAAAWSLNKTVILPIIMSLIFLMMNLISMFFVQNVFSAISYFMITCYLVSTFILLVTYSQKLKVPITNILFVGYYCSAIIATVIGVLAYFHLLPDSDRFLMFGRVKSTFKDPNVFGPYLVFPALYALHLTERRKNAPVGKLIHMTGFLLLMIGIIISFSRAAWGNFAISLFFYLLLIKKEMIIVRLKTIVFLFILVIPIIFFLIQSPAIEELLSTRLTIKNYDSDRFDTQKEAFNIGLANLLGMGPGQSDNEFQYSTHSLYARVFTENGLIGFLSIITIILLSIRRVYLNFRLQNLVEYAGSAIIFSALIGLVFNSFFIDTLHWRHFWIILAFAWFPVQRLKKTVKEERDDARQS